MIARLATATIGVWLMAAPAVLSYGDPAAINDRIVGPTVAALAMIAMAQVMRPVRWAVLPLGIWMAVAPFALTYGGPARPTSLASGVALAALSAIRGRITERYGGGWSSLVRRDAPASAAERAEPDAAAERRRS